MAVQAGTEFAVHAEITQVQSVEAVVEPMGPSRLRIKSVSWMLGALVCAAALDARAESAPRKPTVVSGHVSNMQGLYTTTNEDALIELPSRTFLRMAPNSTARVFSLPQLLALTPGARTWTWSIALQNGRVDVELPKTGRNALIGSMGKLNAIVTAGRAVLQVNNAGDAAVANAGGEVRTVLNDHWQTVPLGWLATLSKDDPNATAKPGLPAPTLTVAQRIWFAPTESVALHGFSWSRVPGAARYDLRLRSLSNGKAIDQRSTQDTEWADGLASVAPGSYSVALRSVDAHGMEGSWGPESEVRVIGLVLPPGAYTTEQAIFIGVGQQVQFTNTAGLEMTYLGAGRYFPAAQGARLYRGQKTVIGFRMPGTLDTAIARLEPRGFYADVQIGPQRAVWPRDPISIQIELKSKNGAPIPAFLQVVPRVTLGLDPVDLDFEQQGNTLHAVMPPSDRPGPWIVRVDVADQFGVALGHDFLEVAAQPAKNSSPAGPAKHSLGMTANVTRPPATEPPVASSN